MDKRHDSKTNRNPRTRMDKYQAYGTKTRFLGMGNHLPANRRTSNKTRYKYRARHRSNRKNGTNVTHKREKLTAAMDQWLKWHKRQKYNRQQIKCDKTAHYEKLRAEAKEARDAGDQSAIWKIIATTSGKRMTQRT